MKQNYFNYTKVVQANSIEVSSVQRKRDSSYIRVRGLERDMGIFGPRLLFGVFGDDRRGGDNGRLRT